MRVGIIGAGFGQYAVAPVYASIGCQVEIASPRDGDAVARLLASSPDLVSVHSPPFRHRAHVMQALERKLNVLCDKPFGLSRAEGLEMRDQAKAQGVLHFLNCEYRYMPSRARMKAMIQAGEIGAIEHVSIQLFSNAQRGRTHGWLNDAALGGGWIGAYGSHVIDTLRWLFDSEIVQCGGVSRIEIPRRPDAEGGSREATAEDAFSAWFLMANGKAATLDTAFSASTPLPVRTLVLGGEGSLELVGDTHLILRRAMPEDPTMSRPERIRRSVLAMAGEVVFEQPPPPGESHEPALRPWFERVKEAVTSGRQITPSFDDGAACADVMDMLREKLIRA
jgi:predicted dehydrogenase